MKRLIPIFLKCIILLLWINTIVSAAGVQPLEIKITGKPGTSVPFKIKFSSTTKQAETLKISLAQPTQRLDGGFEFKPVDPQMFPEAKWISLNTSSITIPQGSEAFLTGVVKIPFDARGTRMLAILAEQPPTENTGLRLAVIYGIKLAITIDAPLPRPTIQISDFEITKGSKGEPNIEFKAKNTSLAEYPTKASVVIRNSQTKKLIEKIQLKPKIYWKNDFDPVILPEATLLYTGFPKEVLLPGDYDLQLFFRYGTSGQTIITKKVTIKAGEFNYSTAKLRLIRVEPNELCFTGKLGATSTKALKFENKSDKKVKIILKPIEIADSYRFSILKNTKIELKNGHELTIEPGRMGVSILSVKYPENSPVQGNYGLLKVSVHNEDNEVIDEFTVMLEALVSGKYQTSAEVADLTTNQNHGELTLAAIIKNTGNVKISPEVTINLKNQDGKILNVIKLNSESEESNVLPERLTTFTGVTTESISPGKYKAEVIILKDSQEINRKTFEIKISG